ncbi:hypothetical protein [Streptomyces sp. TRM68367]|uniref:hypothetical protein n=1 Tax=Streptomyces sp. TRM68367 TaxID=2758415 RepID=UPI0021D0A6BA|nr:hypothetical protein [Streptomyces sp. TRM68367]
MRAVDGHLAVIGPDGVTSRRRRIEPIAAEGRFAASAYEDGPVRVETGSIVRGPWELRVHRVTALPRCVVRDGGYALAGPRRLAVRNSRRCGHVGRVDGLTSVVVALHGFRATATAEAVDANAFGVCSATPYLVAPDHPGGSAVYVSLVVLAGDRVDPAALRASVTASVDGDQVTLRLPDGERIEVVLGTRVSYARYPVEGEPVRWPSEAAADKV